MKITAPIRALTGSGSPSRTMRLYIAPTKHNIQAVDITGDLKKVERMMRDLNV